MICTAVILILLVICGTLFGLMMEYKERWEEEVRRGR